MGTVIRVADVSKRFTIRKDKSLKERMVNFRRSRDHAADFWALRDISFDVAGGTTVGLIGHNGSGKSTLLKIVGGILAPNAGHVQRRGRLAALLELGAGFHGDLTGRENVYLNASILGLTRAQTESYFAEIVNFSGIEPFIDTQVKFYSSGMYVRLAFAVAVHVDPEILLIDEVLAVGDEPFQRRCMDKIKQFQQDGRTIVFVTHALDQIRQLCDRVIMLDKGEMLVDGTPVEAIRVFRDRYNDEAASGPAAGNRQVEIHGVTVTDGDGNPRQRFRPGDTVGIEFDVEAHEPTDNWAAGIAITDSLELTIYGTNTTLEHIELPPLSGRARVRYRFDSIPLVEGQYYVTVAVHPRVGPEYHRLDRTVTFKVFSDARSDGVVHLVPTVDLVQTEAPAR